MTSFPQNHFQQFLQQPTSQPQQPKPFRWWRGHEAGLVAVESGLESKKKRPIEQAFLENNLTNNNSNNNSQLSSADLLQARSVSIGLGLSLENPRLASSGDSALLGLVGDALDRELQRQDAEIDRYIKLQYLEFQGSNILLADIQISLLSSSELSDIPCKFRVANLEMGDRLRQALLEKFQATQLQTISYVEEKVLQKLREKEAEVEDINKKNIELESRMEHLAFEASAWQQRAKYSENMISTLKLNLQQVYAQSRDSKEGCGDSEVDDTASCCNGRPVDFLKDSNGMKELITCKVCRVNEVCMLLLPCKASLLVLKNVRVS
ncbi:hypothetical protein Sango_2971800 [Sesamum angolense]|uniref:Uncharacterized protein n=1 Tax=Sesamum angolense TaxID=2727404 RepID=A0AAE1T3P3_9LAMI|nr:hypothetical protein Sango_2971800 [Sesamum angolense]